MRQNCQKSMTKLVDMFMGELKAGKKNWTCWDNLFFPVLLVG